MKKIAVLLMTLAFVLCGCGKESKEDIVKKLKNSIVNAKSYKVTGNMEISNDEETFMYSLESYYMKDNYYKVVLVNQTNNHEQIILRNKDDIYVITPALNKSFKFQSEWPDNSSQAYLLGSIIKDIEKDSNYELLKKDNGYIIKTKVNYPNNEELKYQKIYINDKGKIEKVEVYNDNDIIKIKVVYEDIDMNLDLKEDEFMLDSYIKEDNLTNDPNKDTSNEQTSSCVAGDNNCEGNDNLNNSSAKNTINIENIIYPLYIPSNTYLSSSEKVETLSGNRIILTFSGEKNFVLIEEAALANTDMEVVPVYGEPLLLSESIGALSANSLSWDAGNISYYLASTELTVKEMQTIANSLGNMSLVANTK